MTDGPEADPESYERKCLAETREQLTRVTQPEQESNELRLEGGYPDTRIAVTLWDRRYGKEVSRSYPIWQTSSFIGYRGVRADPQSVGMLVTTWSLGG